MSGTVDDRVRDRFRREFELGDDVAAVLRRIVAEEAPLAGDAERAAVVDRLRALVVGWGRLEALLDDPLVSDVLVNGGGEVFVECRGVIRPTQLQIPRDELMAVIERIIGPLGLRFDRSNPIVDGRLPDGSRVSAVLPPLSVDGPVFTIRRFSRVPIGLAGFTDESTASLLADIVGARCNVVVYGGTGSGKTTMLGALAGHIDPRDRILTIEDTAELSLGHPHVVRLEAHPDNGEGAGGATIRDLVRCALRLRPDRILVGEVRGAEALDMVWAMSSGHDGSLSTVHASNALDALRRLETFMLLGDAALPLDAVRSQLAAAVDVLVGVERSVGGERRVAGVHRVVLVDDRLLVRDLRTSAVGDDPAREVSCR